jgi:hypothetical protein
MITSRTDTRRVSRCVCNIPSYSSLIIGELYKLEPIKSHKGISYKIFHNDVHMYYMDVEEADLYFTPYYRELNLDTLLGND